MLHSQIRQSMELHHWIQCQLDGLDIPSNTKTTLATSCFDVAIEHSNAITILVQSNLNGTSFALLRLVFEAYVRGVWLLDCAHESDISKYIDDTLNIQFNQLLDAIEQNEAYQEKTLSDLKNKHYKTMCSYTHCGIQQAGRRFTASDGQPDYPPEDLIKVISLANTLALLAAHRISIIANRLDLAIKIHDKLK